MPKNSANTVLQYLRTLAAGKMAAGESDQALLERFAGQRDEAAFAALLNATGRWRWACACAFFRDRHLAEDAFQATFLVLVLKADTLCKREFVPSWLYGVALRLSRKLKAQTCRSQRPDVRPSNQLCRDAPMEAIQREQDELLDEEIQRLPEKYRRPLLLCYFEGLSHQEAARQLGWTISKLRALLVRGRNRLRLRLIRRGVTLVTAATSLLTGTNLSAPSPDIWLLPRFRLRCRSCQERLLPLAERPRRLSS